MEEILDTSQPKKDSSLRDAMVFKICSVCQAPCDTFCSGCKKVYYCCVDHQKSLRKVHKTECFPAILKHDAGLGRCLVASRNIKQGELIFKDKALVTGPSGAELFFHRICLGCYRQVKSGYQCSKCSWPMCSKQCEDMSHHAEYECQVFSGNQVKPYFTKPYQYDLINTLRSLLLEVKEPEKWDELSQLASHAEARAKNFEAMRSSKESMEFIHSVCKLGDEFDPYVIDHIVGIWGINSFGANAPCTNTNPGRARMATLMFPKLCLAAHNCLPNTRGILHEDIKAFRPTYSMELIASLAIKEGEQIHTTYANVNEGTFERRLVLRSNYFFSCECKRCSDSTEFGTFFSAFKCVKCDSGYLIPVDPLNMETSWQCVGKNKCTSGVSSTTYSELKIILSKIRRELNAVANESSLTSIKQLESILKKHQKKSLHCNHWIMIEVEFLLAQRILGYLPKCIKSEEEDFLLNRLVEICQHCLFVADLVQPGQNSYRGKLLYCLTQARLKKLFKGTKNNGLDTILKSKDVLEGIKTTAREAMEILSRDLEGTEDQMLSQILAKDLIQVQTMGDLVTFQEKQG